MHLACRNEFAANELSTSGPVGGAHRFQTEHRRPDLVIGRDEGKLHVGVVRAVASFPEGSERLKTESHQLLVQIVVSRVLPFRPVFVTLNATAIAVQVERPEQLGGLNRADAVGQDFRQVSAPWLHEEAQASGRDARWRRLKLAPVKKGGPHAAVRSLPSACRRQTHTPRA